MSHVAQMAQVNRSVVNDIIRGRSLHPNPVPLERVAGVLKVSVEWLLHGHDDVEGLSPLMQNPDDVFIPIPHAGARVSMGGGMTADGEPGPGRDYHFRRSWIRDRLKAQPSHL